MLSLCRLTSTVSLFIYVVSDVVSKLSAKGNKAGVKRGGMWTYMKHRRDTKQTACVSLHILVNIHQGAKQAPDLAIHDKLEITLRARRQICHADYTTWNCISPWPVSCLYRSQSFSIAEMYISRYCWTSSSVGLSIWGNSTGVPITTWTGT